MHDEPTRGIAWVAAAIRILALWLAVQVLLGLPGFIVNWRSRADYGEQAPMMAASLRASVVYQLSALVVAATLWSTSAWLATLVWREPIEPESGQPPAAIDLQRAVLAGFGIYLVVYGLPNLTDLAYGYYSLPAGFSIQQEYASKLTGRAVGVVIQMVAG